MAEAQHALAQLDFEATLPYIPPDASIDRSVREAIHRMENASRIGDLVMLKTAMLELSELPGTERYLSAPGDALNSAIEYRHLDIVAYLLSNKIKLCEGHVQIATQTQDTRILSVLLAHGWNIDTPLGPAYPSPMAMVVSDYDLTLWFLEHGANPNALCDLDLTPLSVAVESAPMDVIKLLFDHGGSIAHGQLLHHAVRRDLLPQEKVVRLILTMSPPINNIMYQGLNCYFMQRAFGLGTPLHEAVERGKLDIARLLLNEGASPYIRDSLGTTARDRAAILHTDERHAMIELLQQFEACATPPSPQLTDGRRATGWG